jgi:hypothetical protein
MAHTSINPMAGLVLGAVFGALAYYASQDFKKRNGVTPWNLPSWLWGVIGFMSLLICAILMAIASRKTKSALRAAAYGAVSPVPGAPTPPPLAPTYAAAVAVARAPVPAGWHPDPAGHYASRFWDGARWTEHVSDGTTTTTDPL